jgi:hypothetical protein
VHYRNGGCDDLGLSGQEDFEREAFLYYQEDETERVRPKRKPGFDPKV